MAPTFVSFSAGTPAMWFDEWIEDAILGISATWELVIYTKHLRPVA
jgi:hypothetical protein